MRIKPRWLILGASAAAVTASLADNKWDINAIGIVRFGRAAFTAAAISADYKFRVYGRQMPENEEEVKHIWSSAHRRSAERLLDLAKANKGVFIKVGQHLGALDYLLPPEYIETLKILHSQAPSSPLQDVLQVIKEDLQNDTDKVFKKFDPEPIGAASLAQVYKAELKTGEIVAVKVQHRDVLPHSKVDIKTMEVLTQIAAWIFPDFKLLWLAEETKRNLPNELNFLHEGRNADKVRGLAADCDWLMVPKIYWEFSSKRVLTMEFCDGGQINDLKYLKDNKISTKEVCEKLGLLYADMIFNHGFVHCDPHPGNIIIRKRSRDNEVELCLLDHGLYTTLSDEFRYSYSQLWLCILNSDVDGIKKHSMDLGVGEMYGLFACMITGRSWESIASKDGITKVKLTKDEENAIRKNVGSYLPQISDILARVPKPMILIFKTNDLIRGVEASLKNQKSMYSFMTMAKFCTRAVYKEQRRKCDTYYCYFKYKLIETFTLAKISLFQWFLWLRTVVDPVLSVVL
ncbi:unnamed protein product [Orchesella dallaii]|uniref:Protein kinase domain-containing protein n=1 Tax=Orchesella dallaii TaxID=48710 RepID=A0ABP1QWZ8_9HEXA